MVVTESQAFSQLFQTVCTRCFGRAIEQPLSEPESRHLSNDIEEKTGLVVGWKSLKNYSVFVQHEHPEKSENPSVATLDTLARYLADAPVSTEAQRKRDGAHFAYWFRYLEQCRSGEVLPITPPIQKKRRWIGWAMALMTVLAAAGLYWVVQSRTTSFSTTFQLPQTQTLLENGWLLLSKDDAHWQRRNEQPDCLTLFTLDGDNWHSKSQTPSIRNLLVRKIQDDCFSTEVHFTDFIPQENWQQAGLLLLEDTAQLDKSLRISLAYNDFFGGYDLPGEIIVQVIAGIGKNTPNVEEVQHHRLFSRQEGDSSLVRNNLHFSALRIEKQGKHFRFLYAASPFEQFSYKELGTYDFDFQPRFVGVFALKGFVESAAVLPVKVKFFGLEGVRCE